MKRYANVVVELSKAAAVLLVLRTAEVVFSSITEDTQSESVLQRYHTDESHLGFANKR